MAAAEKQSSKEPSKEAASKRSDPGEIWRHFEDAYRQYLRALQDAQVEGQRQYAEAYRGYSQAQYSVHTDMRKRHEEAYRSYIGALQEAWGQEDARQRAEDAYRESMKSLEEEQSRIKKSSEQTHNQLAEAVQQAGTDVQRRMQDAYQNYVKALQHAWSQADVNAVDAGMLATISQSMMAAASLTGSAVASPQASSH